MIGDIRAGVNFQQPTGITRREHEEALRMIRQRARIGLCTTERTLGTSLCWRPSHAEQVAVSMINLGLVDDVQGDLCLTERGRRLLT